MLKGSAILAARASRRSTSLRHCSISHRNSTALVGRCEGSFRNIRLRRLLIRFGNGLSFPHGGSVPRCCAKTLASEPVNGASPVSRYQRVQPREYISDLASTSHPSICSGLANCAVPTKPDRVALVEPWARSTDR